VAHLHVLHAFLLHLARHRVYKMAALVVHYGVQKHEHDIPLELCRISCCTQLNILLDC
jgi:hypothetical protein